MIFKYKIPLLTMRKTLLFLLLALSAMTARADGYRNPVIPGYHPDPSICRVGNDYYLVNSSFHYFPGVPLYHSKDLVHWRLVANVLTRPSQLPLKGASSWLGIYAPTIRYHEGTYYMITTNVGNGGNFLVTAQRPEGPWSEPVWLQQQGIDPSLYFEDGKCYMVSNPDNTIMLCEIDPSTGRQLTESRALWRGTGGRYPEGPHIYKKDGWYYLLISEGGTELAHRLTIARSRDIYGPYEANPANPILTNCSMKGQSLQIQGTGHGDFVQAPDGSWWMVLLAYRNFGGSYHHLGRETYLAPVEWKEGEWPVVNGGEPIDTLMRCRLPQAVEETAQVKQQKRKRQLRKKTAPQPRANFLNPQGGDAAPEWLFIQNPLTENYAVGDTSLVMKAHGTLTANDRPTFVGRRQESAAMTLDVAVSPAPGKSKAGLTVYQIHGGHLDLFVTPDSVGVDAQVMSLYARPAARRLPAGADRVFLRIASDGLQYQFFYSLDGVSYTLLTTQQCALVSTETVGGFTGVVLGMYADEGAARFTRFSYKEHDKGNK